MAVTSASCHFLALPKPFIPSAAATAAAASFDPRSTAANHGGPDKPSACLRPGSSSSLRHLGFSSALILRFPPNFVRQLSTKARRNCSNIGVAQIVAASWSNNTNPVPPPSAAAAIDGPLAAVPLAADADSAAVVFDGIASPPQTADGPKAAASASAIFSSDGSLAVHAGEFHPSHPSLLSMYT